MEDFTELVYAGECESEAQSTIKEYFPDSKFEDASDEIHEGRFEVSLPHEQRDDFYVRMIVEGLARACLGFELMIRMPESHDEVKRLIDLASNLKEQ